jgi:hypothetical protein
MYDVRALYKHGYRHTATDVLRNIGGAPEKQAEDHESEICQTLKKRLAAKSEEKRPK